LKISAIEIPGVNERFAHLVYMQKVAVRRRQCSPRGLGVGVVLAEIHAISLKLGKIRPRLLLSIIGAYWSIIN